VYPDIVNPSEETDMALSAKYTAPLQVVETPEMRDRIKLISDREGVSQAEVIRDMNRYSIEWREALSRERLEQL
jgi:hypothetical protein